MQINAAAVGWIVGICLVSQQAALPSYVSILFALTGLVFVGIGVRFWGASIGGSNGGLIGGSIHGQWINAALWGLFCVWWPWAGPHGGPMRV